MRQIYSRAFTVTFTTGDSAYVFTEKIDPGQILHVHACFAYAPEREANDNIIIGVRNGGQDIILVAVATLAAQRGANTPTDFFIGEGDQLYAYFPNVDNTDSIGIHVNGVIMSRKEWEAMPE